MFMLIIVRHEYSMLKLIFDKNVNFFFKKFDVPKPKGGDFKNGASHSDFMFVNIEPYKSKRCVSY